MVFLIIIFQLLNGIEESFNQIWGVQSSRSIADKIRNAQIVIPAGPRLGGNVVEARGADGTYTLRLFSKDGDVPIAGAATRYGAVVTVPLPMLACATVTNGPSIAASVMPT